MAEKGGRREDRKISLITLTVFRGRAVPRNGFRTLQGNPAAPEVSQKNVQGKKARKRLVSFLPPIFPTRGWPKIEKEARETKSGSQQEKDLSGHTGNAGTAVPLGKKETKYKDRKASFVPAETSCCAFR